MKHHLLALLTVASLTVPAAALAQPAATTFIPDIGKSSPADWQVDPKGINNLGQVAMSVGAPAPTHAFLWSAAELWRDIGVVGPHWTSPAAINDLGVVVGLNLTAGMSLNEPLIWDATNGWRVMRGLTQGFPKAINNHNVVIGGSWQGSFIWDEVNGPTFPFASGLDPVAINDAGQVVGTDYSSYPYRAFVWDSTHGVTYIPQLAGAYSQATDINNRGQVVGSAHVGGTWHGFIWDSTNGLTTLGNFGPYEDWDFGTYEYSGVTAINDLGQAVGTTSSPGGYMAFVWDPVNGMRDLLGTTWLFPSAINNRGEVVGPNFSRSAFYAVVPPPPPPTPQGQAAVIEDTIETLVTSGAIQQNDATVLTKAIDQAIKSLDSGNIGAASNQLGAAVNKVNAMMNSGRISQAQGQALKDALNSVRASL